MIYTYDLSGNPASGAKCGVRPVINLKSDINYKGNGSMETPYEIVIN